MIGDLSEMNLIFSQFLFVQKKQFNENEGNYAVFLYWNQIVLWKQIQK